MKRFFLIILLVVPLEGAQLAAQLVLSLEECRELALENNNNLLIKREEVGIAVSTKKEARTHHLPSVSATASYLRNGSNISLLSEDKFTPVGTVMPDGSFGFTQDQVNNQWTTVNGSPVPLDGNGQPFDPKLNPEKIEWKGHAYLPKDEFTVDTKNIFLGAVSLMQPIYMGGKIRQLNKIAGYAIDIAESQYEDEVSETIYAVDAAYWQAISLSNKLKVAEKFQKLVEALDADVGEMMVEGVATRSDILKVKVKLNEADLNVMKVQNGVRLSKMLLCQITGLPMDSELTLVDENISSYEKVRLAGVDSHIYDAQENRSEVKQLEQVLKIRQAQVKVNRADFLPSVGFVANYMWANPNIYNGFVKEFKGSWSVGVMATIPIFHWGERRHKMNSARAEHRIVGHKLDDAKEKIELQVRRSMHQINEANVRLEMVSRSLDSALENMRMAQEGYKEGVISLSDLLVAQTAWESANSEQVDAVIDAKLCEVYLQKATGNLK